MFDWIKRKLRSKQPMSEHPLRSVLFGDVPLDSWAAGKVGEPWESFAAASGLLGEGNQSTAVAKLTAILERPGLESRQYLQAWTVLRELGVHPAEAQAKHVYGVVFDVPMPSGLDTLAGYADRSARYLHFSGAAVVWEHPDTSLDSRIEELLKGGHSLARKIGPWEGPRPALAAGHARISVLTPSGIHFGQGPFNLLASDPMASRAVDAAADLMQALIAKTEWARATTA